MIVHCVHCQCTLKVPEAAVGNPRARIGCGRCRGSFLLSEARPAAEPPAAPPAPVRVAVPSPPPAAAAAPPVAPAPAPRPAPARAAAPPAASAGTAVAGPAAATAPATAPAARPAHPPAPGSWRRCAQHSRVRSEFVCPACNLGHCRECVQRLRDAAICPTCEGLCLPAAQVEEKERRAQQRARPLMGEIGTIFAYPFTDALAYFLMAVVVGVVNLMKGFAPGPGALFSQGLLMAYSFNALQRVSNGEMKGFMPSIGDVSDLATPMRQGVFAFLGATWPLITIMIVAPFALVGFEGMIADAPAPAAVVHAQAEGDEEAPEPPPSGGEVASDEEPEDAEAEKEDDRAWAAERDVPQRTLLVLLALAFAVLWKVVYSPVALIVAAMTQSAGFFSSLVQTLNPLVGIGAILRMGSTYWQALVLYLMIAVPQALIGGVLGALPFGGFFRAFVDGYAVLCIGCALGLAVFKKAPELGLD